MNMSNNTVNSAQDAANLAERQVDKLASRAEQAIRSTQQAATHALDQLAGAVQDAHDSAVPKLERMGARAEALATRGIDAARQGSQQLRDKAHQTSDRTVGYIREEPVKSVLIAVAVGAALMGLLSVFARSPRHPN